MSITSCLPLLTSLLVLVGVLACASRHENASLSRRAQALRLTARFITCAENDDLPCLKSLSTWDEPELEAQRALIDGRRAAIGKRLSGRPEEGSWLETPTHAASDGARRPALQVKLSAQYEREPNAQELFVIIENSGEMRVQRFVVLSPRLVDQALRGP